MSHDILVFAPSGAAVRMHVGVSKSHRFYHLGAHGEEFCFQPLLNPPYIIHPMDIQNTVNLMMDDLVVMARFDPKERLPKEEQIRCAIYAAIRPLFEVICAERRKSTIDCKRTEAGHFADTG